MASKEHCSRQRGRVHEGDEDDREARKHRLQAQDQQSDPNGAKHQDKRVGVHLADKRIEPLAVDVVVEGKQLAEREERADELLGESVVAAGGDEVGERHEEGDGAKPKRERVRGVLARGLGPRMQPLVAPHENIAHLKHRFQLHVEVLAPPRVLEELEPHGAEALAKVSLG
eukprot:CAMPEP_0202051720 /NCGR_PEP_ID=MMETSP0963-20130614/4797_1 /ASSEMBLY_ACC=CAM_ASM_000494 /TAXON_ID=4773 /ORGANISM="Schizochytrium aggregatum, Strain ATCC28209" /LENGTH=170 /DNA_ID=CAMNT_0048616913 /DNA_START=374 /DNA_END=886 /DNA_ORIENTATION=+